MSGKIDDTLLLKSEIIRFLRELSQQEDLTTFRLERELDKLLNSDDRAVPLLLNIFSRCKDPVLLDMIAYAFEYLDDESIVDPLFDMLLNPKTTKEAKLRIISVLSKYGYEDLSVELEGIAPELSKELDELAEANFNELMGMAQNDDEVLSLLMDEIDGLSREAKLDYISYLKGLDVPGVIRVLEMLGSIIGDDVIAEEAIRAISTVKSPESISALRRIARRTVYPRLKSLAERGIRKLMLMGVPQPDESFFKPAAISLIVLTPIDGNGDRSIWVCGFSKERDKMRFSGFTINTDIGLKECYGRSSLKEYYFFFAYEDLRKKTNPIEIPAGYALKLLKDALHRSLESGIHIPYRFAVWAQIFDAADLTPEKYEINWDDRFEDIDVERLFTETGLLFYRSEFRDWYDHSPKAMEYYMRASNLKSGEKLDSLIRRYALEVFEPRRESIRRSLELMADFFWMERLREREAALAFVAASKLGDRKLPIYKHPFIAMMIEHSFHMAGMLFRRRGNSEKG